MKLCSVVYLTKEGIKNIWKNRMMSMASIGVLVICFMLTGIFSLLSISIKDTLKSIESRNTIKVFLKNSVDTKEALDLEQKLKNISNVLSVRFYSRTEAQEKYKDQLGDIYENMKNRNFLPHSYYVTLKDISEYKETVSKIRELPEVDLITNKADLFDKLNKFNRFISSVGAVLSLILSLIALFIITNTIRLTMYSRRYEISIMKSVGATDFFVKLPFMVEGIVIGIFSAVVSAISLNFLYKFIMDSIRQNVSFFYSPGFNNLVYYLLFYFTLAGIAFGILGGGVSIRKYLVKGKYLS